HTRSKQIIAQCSGASVLSASLTRRQISLVLVAALAAAAAQTAPSLAESINEIKPPSSVRLDPYIRRALLKALSELEESDKITTDFTSTDGSTDGSTYGTETTDTHKTTDYNTESIPTETSKEGIQIHSFIVNGQAAFANTTPNDVPTYINDNISILSTTSVNVDQVTSTLPTNSPFNEIFQTSQTGVNLQQTRSVGKNSNSNNDIGGAAKTTTNAVSTTRVTRPTTTSTTTTTTTTTTTPKPTHNDDGQNIEEVNKKDVQVFQAPLVAAFTVHQDANGLPKKVVPLLPADSRQTLKPQQVLPLSIPQNNNNNFRQQNINNNIRQEVRQQEFRQQDLRQQEIIQQQLTLQKQLEEKQRFLEEQLRILQQQQRQQEELLRKQQYLLQQKEIERQQQFEQFSNHNQLKRQESFDKQRVQNNQAANNFQFQNFQKNVPNQSPVQNNSVRPQTQQVSIQQSVAVPFPNNGAGVQQTNNLGNQQQLPNREAVDFLITLRSQQSEQFPLQDNHLPQGISNFLQPTPVFGQAQNFQQNFNQIRPAENGGRQSNRVFRQESGVGNFGFNQNQNQNYQRFNTFVPIQSPRFFGSNRQNQGNPNSDLQQLLYQTGLNGRNHEDLNIVTKVLSLNHGVPFNNNISNRLPFDSRRHSRTN
ncbi:unnamed protein product, partial [Plutella xylostella]